MRFLLDSILFSILYPLVLFGFLALGFFYSRQFYIKRNEFWKPVGIENGLIGIYALLISFTMVGSGNYVRERSEIIHQEADEIALVFRTSKFYKDTLLQNQVHRYLRDFLSIQFSNSRPSPEECLQLIDSIEATEKMLDLFLIDYVRKNPSAKAEVNSLILSLEKAESRYYLLLYTFMERTPVPLMITLVALSFIIAFLIGFMNSFQENQSFVVPVIFILIITPHYEDLINVQKVVKSGY